MKKILSHFSLDFMCNHRIALGNAINCIAQHKIHFSRASGVAGMKEVRASGEIESRKYKVSQYGGKIAGFTTPERDIVADIGRGSRGEEEQIEKMISNLQMRPIRHDRLSTDF